MVFGYCVKCSECNHVFMVKMRIMGTEGKPMIAKFRCPFCQTHKCIRYDSDKPLMYGLDITFNRANVQSYVETYLNNDDFRGLDQIIKDIGDRCLIKEIQDSLPEYALKCPIFLGHIKNGAGHSVRLDVLNKHRLIKGGRSFEKFGLFSATKNQELDDLSIGLEMGTAPLSFEKMLEWGKITEHEDKKKIFNGVKECQQAFFFSDSPVEWLNEDGVPLSFLVDTCRLPIWDDVKHNLYLSDIKKKHVHISSDILTKTLVLMCSSSDMENVYEEQRIFFDQHGVSHRTCSTKKEFFDYINTLRPTLLIIDSHGNFDVDEDVSYITIENEKIGADDINDLNNLSFIPPIILVSACNTRPPIQLDQCVIDAFVERGTIAITAAYVPLMVAQANALIVRLINNLSLASLKKIHPNWLSFIAHLQRMFFVQTLSANGCLKSFNKTKEQLLQDVEEIKKKDVEHAKEYDFFAKNLKEMCDCKDVLALEMTLVNFSKAARKYYHPKWVEESKGLYEPEHLFYTTYGRADLIPFDEYYKAVDQEHPTLTHAQHFERLVKAQPLINQMMDKIKRNIGRNDLCWCNSGLKYKKCHWKKENGIE